MLTCTFVSISLCGLDFTLLCVSDTKLQVRSLESNPIQSRWVVCSDLFTADIQCPKMRHTQLWSTSQLWEGMGRIIYII